MSLCSLVPGELGRKCVRAKYFANSITGFYFNLWYTGGLFHSYMLEESICHFRGVESILSLYR